MKYLSLHDGLLNLKGTTSVNIRQAHTHYSLFTQKSIRAHVLIYLDIIQNYCRWTLHYAAMHIINLNMSSGTAAPPPFLLHGTLAISCLVQQNNCTHQDYTLYTIITISTQVYYVILLTQSLYVGFFTEPGSFIYFNLFPFSLCILLSAA